MEICDFGLAFFPTSMATSGNVAFPQLEYPLRSTVSRTAGDLNDCKCGVVITADRIKDKI